MSFWSTYELEVGATYHWKIGLLDLWVECAAGEWRVASLTGREGHDALVRLDEKTVDVPVVAAEKAGKPDDVPWRRVLAPGAGRTIELMPIMPDRSLVVRPEEPLIIPPKTRGTFYVSVPVFVSIRTADGPPVVLGEAPTAVLSNTWFGDPASGELCYSLPTRARRELGEGRAQPHRAVCPVQLVNASGKDLQFQRLMLQVGALAVFDGDEQLSTGDVEVTFQTEEQTARVKFGAGASKIPGVTSRLTDARTPRKESVLGRGFTTIRSLTGL